MFFFFNDTATTEIYTLSLHDALPICGASLSSASRSSVCGCWTRPSIFTVQGRGLSRSGEHTSELQSQSKIVCRLLLEKKKKQKHRRRTHDIHLDSSRHTCTSLSHTDI